MPHEDKSQQNDQEAWKLLENTVTQLPMLHMKALRQTFMVYKTLSETQQKAQKDE